MPFCVRVLRAGMNVLAWYFFSMKGRISRQEFWWGYAATFVFLFLVRWKLEDLFIYLRRPMDGLWYRDELEFVIALPKILAPLIVIWSLTVIHVKRLHDINLSGWWLPVMTAACVGGASMSTHLLSFGFTGVLAVIGVFPGMQGGNRFGADPLAHGHVQGRGFL